MLLILKNKLGFSLPEIIIALGMVAGISIVTMKLMEEQSSNEAFIKANAEINKTISQVQTSLNNLDKCRALLAGKKRSNSIEPDDDLDAIITSIQETLVRNGAVIGTKIHLETPNAAGLPAPNNIRNYGSFYMRHGDIALLNTDLNMSTVADLFLRFRYNKKSIVSWGSQDDDNDAVIIKRLRVVVTLNPLDNTVTSCGPIVSEANQTAKQKFCDSFAGSGATEWVGDLATGSCRLKSMDCPWGQVPQQLNNFGPPTCVDLHQRLDLNQIFINGSSCPSGSGAFKFEVQADGRIGLNCNP